MKVRTADGKVHDLPVPDATRLMHTGDAVPVVDSPEPETRPAKSDKVEKRG